MLGKFAPVRLVARLLVATVLGGFDGALLGLGCTAGRVDLPPAPFTLVASGVVGHGYAGWAEP